MNKMDYEKAITEAKNKGELILLPGYKPTVGNL